MRVASGLLRPDHDVTAGMYPQYWMGDVRVDSPIGDFACRAHTIDFDIVNPNYEAIELRIFRERLGQVEGAGAVCVDMGAHIGKFSILAGRQMGNRGTVYAFEPEPANFKQLERNIALNGLHNVNAVNAAGGREDGTQLLSLSTTNIGAHTIANRDGAQQIPVRVRSLDSFLAEREVRRVDVMKLDVEYREAEVLHGARRTLEANPRLTVLFEETAAIEVAESVRLLHSLGYGVQKVARNICVAYGPGSDPSDGGVTYP